MMSKMYKQLSRITLVLGLMFVGVMGWGQIIDLAGWEMNGLSSYGPSPFAPATLASNITAVGLTRGSGVTTSGTAAGSAWGGNGFNDADLTAAIEGSKFATFSLTPNTGFNLSITSIQPYNIRRSGTGPTTGQWQFSLDGVAFTNIGSAITWGGTTNASGNSQSAINLSTVSDLQDIPSGTTVTFRLVNWAASTAGGTWYINNFQTGNDLIIRGSIEAAMPVDLLSFDATLRNGQTYLDWSFDNARGFDRFAIDHATDRQDWAEIGVVHYTESISRSKQAQFTHTRPSNGANYYRLRMIDEDGSVKISRIQSVQLRRAGGFAPVNTLVDSELYISRSGEMGTAQLSIIDLQGRVMEYSIIPEYEDNARINMNGWAPGVYLLQVITGSDSETFKIVKN